jgi:hypothetical protein
MGREVVPSAPPLVRALLPPLTIALGVVTAGTLLLLAAIPPVPTIVAIAPPPATASGAAPDAVETSALGRVGLARWAEAWSPGASAQPLAGGWPGDPVLGPPAMTLQRLSVSAGASVPLTAHYWHPSLATPVSPPCLVPPVDAEAAVKFAPHEDDPRQYLNAMAAWGSRRRLITPTALDPSAASLDPGAHVGYFTIVATPFAPDRCRSREPGT